MQTIVNRSKRAAALLVVLSMLLSMFSINVFALEGTTAVAQGMSQTAILFDNATEAAHTNVTVLNSATSPANEGSDYYFDRVESVYDISGGKDLKVQIKYSAGMNAYSDDAWKGNGARYFSVIDVETGRVVASWADDSTAMGSINSEGAYQVSYAASALAANVGGVIYTIPNAALEYNHRYWVVQGSATCGNNNAKMLFAPIIYEITTSGEDGTGTVTASNKTPEANTITLETVNATNADTVAFNRYAGGTTGSGASASYAAGEAITSSVVGWEIPVTVTSTNTYTTYMVSASDGVIPVNAYAGAGNNASSFGDIRFTMPNSDAKIIVVFGDVVAPTGVTLNKTTATVDVDATTNLTATVAPADASVADVAWKTSDASVATVDNGVVTGVSAGTATITAITADGTQKATCEVTVQEDAPVVAVTGVELDKEGEVAVAIDGTITATPTISPADATNKAVTWTSSDDTVATVTDGVVTGVAIGTATITVTTADGNFTDSFTVNVTDAVPHLVDGYYEIYTAEQLQWFSEEENDGNAYLNAKLMDDIDLTTLTTKFTSIGKSTKYSGIFDGNGKTITVSYADASSNFSGDGALFYIMKGAVVKNLILEGEVTPKRTFGVLAYQADDDNGKKSVIENVASYVNVTNGHPTGSAAGVMYRAYDVVVKNCANFGQVTGTSTSGGIVAVAGAGSEFYNCVNYGVVKGTRSGVTLGGIAGEASSAKVVMYNCYNAGNIGTTGTYVGAIVGNLTAAANVKNCYYLEGSYTTPVGSAVSASNYDASQFVSKTEAEMKTQDFVTALSGSGVTANRAFVYKADNYAQLRWLAGEDTATVTGIEIITPPTQTVYDVHEDFDPAGMVITAKYSDNTSEIVLSHEYTYAPTETLTTDVSEITISYNGMTATQPISVYEYPLEKIEIKKAPNKTLYTTEGEAIDLTGLQLTVSYTKDGTTVTETITEGYSTTVTEFTTDMESIPVSYAYNGVVKSVDVPITNAYTKSMTDLQISTKPTKYIYEVGETPDLTGTNLKATFGEGDEAVTFTITEGFTASAPAAIADDTENITISYTAGDVTLTADTPILIKTTDPTLNEDGYYEIYDEYQFEWFALQVLNVDTTIDGILMADIDLTRNHTFIGATSAKAYAGTFDGNGHSVEIAMVGGQNDYLAVFPYVGGATIKNLTVDGSITGGSYVGGIVAKISLMWNATYSGATIINCVNNADIVTHERCYRVGGIVGENSCTSTEQAITILNCENNGDITGGISYAMTGGIIGNAGAAKIDNCVNTGELKGYYVAGIVGQGMQYTYITACANFGDIGIHPSITAAGVVSTGGIVAYASSGSGVTIKDCYNAGDVDGGDFATNVGGIFAGGRGSVANSYNSGTISSTNASAQVGAIFGLNDRNKLTVSNCYYLEGSCGYAANNAATYDGVTVLTADELKVAAEKLSTSFRDDIDPAINSGYPILKWQVPATSFKLTGETAITDKETATITAVATPDGAGIETLVWTSSDKTIATVDDNGVVTPVATGTVTITATTFDGTLTASIEIVITCEHDYLLKTVTEATCTEQGRQEVTCERCGDVALSYRVPVLDHSFTEYVSNGDATCEADGTKTATCDNCDATDTVADEGSMVAHSFTNYVSNGDATCTADGTKTATCDNCDATDTVADEGSKLEHSFTTYVSNNDATCTADGTKTATCDNCDATDTVADEGTKLEHSFTTYVSNNDATCTADGTKTATCDNCDATDTVVDTGSATGHTPIEVPAKEPTTTEVGNTAGHKCDVCGTILDGCEEIPVLVDTEITVEKAEDGNWYAYQNGEILTTYTGFADNEYGTWYVENGQVTFNKNDIIKDTREGEGDWKYVKGSKFTVTDTVAKNSNGWWRVEDGIVNFSATGVYQNENGWWYCKDGQVQFGYTGIQNNENGWWRIVGGKVDFSATGVFKNEYGWWYCKDGKVQFDYTGVQKNDYGWWRIESGKVNFNFTGIATNEYGKWYLENGKVDFSYSGLYKYNGTYYSIKDGKVV